MQFAVISYWCGEFETPKVWLYATYEEAEKALENLYNQSIQAARKDENFDEDDCDFVEGSYGKVSWTDGLGRWFEVANVSNKEVI